jgi:Saxitoxin biosynthesis operon protein SxtJ
LLWSFFKLIVATQTRTKGIGVQDGHHEPGQGSAEEKSSSDRSFGIVFAVVFFLLAARGLWHGYSTWPAYIVLALGFLLIGLFRPALLAPLNKIWTKLGSILGKIISPIVLGGLFFLVIAPAAFIFRALGKDLLNLRRDPGIMSYWLVRDPPGPTPESINDQF